MDQRPSFERWLGSAVALVKKHAAHQLLTIGSEGATPWAGYVGSSWPADHGVKGIDFATLHIWPFNWGWFKAGDDLDKAVSESLKYLRKHVDWARELRMPLVLEEFGFPRDGGSCVESAATSKRDAYYAAMFEAVRASAEQGGPLVGAMFWGWGGEGRPREKRDACSAGGAKAFFEQGDDLLSDPPHETQGWYSVYDADLSTKVVLRAFAESLATYVPGG